MTVASDASIDAGKVTATKINKRNSGFGTVVTSVILIAAVAMIGSVVVIWANTGVNVHRQQSANLSATEGNQLRETLLVDDVWLSKNPQYYVNITLRNAGDLALKIKQVKLVAHDFNGVNVGCTGTPSCEREVTGSFNSGTSDGLISSQQELMISIDNIYWSHPNTSLLDITITTERGLVKNFLWGVK